MFAPPAILIKNIGTLTDSYITTLIFDCHILIPALGIVRALVMFCRLNKFITAKKFYNIAVYNLAIHH